MINSVFDFAIGIIICFLDGFLVVILILGFFCPSLLFLALIIFATSSATKVGNASLIHKISSTFSEVLAFKACVYDFLMLESFGTFLLIELIFLSEGGIANDNSIADEVETDNLESRFRFRFEVVDFLVFSTLLF